MREEQLGSSHVGEQQHTWEKSKSNKKKQLIDYNLKLQTLQNKVKKIKIQRKNNIKQLRSFFLKLTKKKKVLRV
jgi:hypothetical protein